MNEQETQNYPREDSDVVDPFGQTEDMRMFFYLLDNLVIRFHLESTEAIDIALDAYVYVLRDRGVLP